MVASRNRGKLKEIAGFLSDLRICVISMEEAGFCGCIEETGSSFSENAIIKARTVHDATGLAVIADDSGLEVDCLGGKPGVYSSRFAGDKADDGDKISKLLDLLKDVPYDKRNARFVCVIAAVARNGEVLTAHAECKGFIAEEPAGDEGFGYDPVFFVREFGCTMAQLEAEVKNSISHRGKALRLMKKKLESAPEFII